jgi:hypothetical protein
MSTYQGHHPDGSSIQRHSCGAQYPYVIGQRDRADQAWFVWAPDGTEVTFQTSHAAMSFACAAAKVYH